MKIIVTSVLVNDQDKALEFYTEKLGFVVKVNMPVGEYKWLTVVSPDELSGVELLLEPNAHPAAQVFQKKIYDDGIPAHMFGVDNIQETYEKLKANGVSFTMEPTEMDGYYMAVLDDTCGNLIQLIQQ